MLDVVKAKMQEGIAYDAYKEMIEQLLDAGKTTGPNQSESFIHYTKMNAARMKRWDKKTQLLPEAVTAIGNVMNKQTWLVITEAWCGDAAQILPVINKLADLNPNINVLHVLRDEHPDLMEHFLTNGGKSIPVVIVYDHEENKVLGSFGPRPKEMQQMVMDRKNDPNPMPYEEFSALVQKWYNQDKTVSIQKEFIPLLKA